MARLPVVSRDMVPEQFREAFDELTSGSGGAITSGPGAITINSPEMALRRNHLTNYLRFETTFPKKIQELAILTTARAMDCQYIWDSHAPDARAVGVSDALIDALIDALRDHSQLPSLSADEEAVVNYGMELFKTHKVEPKTFQAALTQFGPQHLVELTVLMGHYAQTAFFLNAFDSEQSTEPVLPI